MEHLLYIPRPRGTDGRNRHRDPAVASTRDAVRNPDSRNIGSIDDIQTRPNRAGDRAAVNTNSPTVSVNP